MAWPVRPLDFLEHFDAMAERLRAAGAEVTECGDELLVRLPDGKEFGELFPGHKDPLTRRDEES